MGKEEVDNKKVDEEGNESIGESEEDFCKLEEGVGRREGVEVEVLVEEVGNEQQHG